MNGGTQPSGYYDHFNTVGPAITVNQGGSAGHVKWIDGPFWAGAHCYVVTPGSAVDKRFLFHVLKWRESGIRNSAHGTTIPGLSRSALGQIKVPVPAPDVQVMIAQTLDRYMDLQEALELALDSELELRRSQVQYFRELLLRFDSSDTPYFQVGEICEVSRGRVISRDYLAEHPGDFPVYSSQTLNGGVFGYIDTFAYDFESITWTTDGANAGSVFYHNNEKFSITNVCGLLKVRDASVVSSRYLFRQLESVAKEHVSAGMGNPKLMAAAMKAIRIPIPSMDEQDRVSNALERLDSLQRDLIDSLSTELAARRKQYEYYRDKLLTFEEAPA